MRALICLLFTCFSILIFAQEETSPEKLELQNRYKAFLAGKGYDPEIDSDGDVKFMYNDRRYYITLHEGDAKFFRIATIGKLTLTSEESINQVYSICHDITKDVKISKVYWLDDYLWTSTELLLNNPDDYIGIFDRGLKETEKTYLKFVTAWKNRGD